MTWLADTVAWLSNGANWSGPDGAGSLLAEHLRLSAVSLLIAAVLVVPLGLWLGHVGRGGAVALNIGNVGRAVPTFAVLVLLALAPRPFGLGDLSIVTALVLFAIPPVLTNTYVGVREVDRAAVDAARGMGMSGGEIIRRVELPLALPLIFGGIKTSTVNVIATATIAPLVGVVTLGDPLVAFSVYGREGQIGASIIVAVLAIVAEVGLSAVQRAVTPAGIKLQRGDDAARTRFGLTKRRIQTAP
jgi:osmoprotectant transport system permease protein